MRAPLKQEQAWHTSHILPDFLVCDMAAHVPRALSGLFCSTSRQPESLFIRCGASRADASRHEPWLPVQGPGVGSWVGTGCNLQRRPQLPQISSKVREGAAIVQGLQPSPNGNGVSRDGDSFVSTQFVAESLIPTHCGKYRVRAYRHSVSTPQPVATLEGVERLTCLSDLCTRQGLEKLCVARVAYRHSVSALVQYSAQV